ncbi:MAG: fibronectin type III-like domain-contianing protein, partial [Lachnospiraceae bacterium]|nr:fibronectin type III-like domain-contianing protein [Lachnospiraceae bacterium]
VLLNIGGLIDLKAIEENPAVKAIVYISQPGMSGGHAVADVLSGDISPSGKLTDTWAVSYTDYPNHATFSHCNGNVTTEKYEEGLFVGYRYFDTYEIPVQYCFGHGLSYTEFEIASSGDIQADEKELKLTFTVKNLGNAAGKEVVQVYAALPAGGLTKEFRRLAGFAKTGLLQPGETETVTVTIDAKMLASFDESQCAWILEAGKYVLLAGSSLENADPTAVVLMEKTVVLEKTHAICPLQEELEELAGKEVRRAERLGTLLEMCGEKKVPEIAFAPEEREMPVCRKSVAAVEASELVEKLTTEELITMCVGEISHGHDVALGATGIMVPGAAGESSSILEEKYGVPGIAMADGPAGIRILKKYWADEANRKVYTQGFLGAIEQGFFAPEMEQPEGTTVYYQYCTAFPIGTMLAQTWNREIQEEVGRHVGVEMEELGIGWWLAPGMNIHRNPLCGRNFEYFAEDPLVSGKTAAAITRGVQSIAGVGTTIKHFCANNQEDNRFGSNSILSPRVLREIYLRGFEIAVRESQPMSIMSSYNLVNGVHTANCEDILLTVLRKEWGFRGFVMTDWTTTSNGSTAWKCTRNGNDLIMPGCPDDLVSIRQALESGELTMEELKASVTRLLTVILQTNAFEDAVAYRYI